MKHTTSPRRLEENRFWLLSLRVYLNEEKDCANMIYQNTVLYMISKNEEKHFADARNDNIQQFKQFLYNILVMTGTAFLKLQNITPHRMRTHLCEIKNVLQVLIKKLVNQDVFLNNHFKAKLDFFLAMIIG